MRCLHYGRGLHINWHMHFNKELRLFLFSFSCIISDPTLALSYKPCARFLFILRVLEKLFDKYTPDTCSAVEVVEAVEAVVVDGGAPASSKEGIPFTSFFSIQVKQGGLRSATLLPPLTNVSPLGFRRERPKSGTFDNKKKKSCRINFFELPIEINTFLLVTS